jgi:hypothetical protein
MEKPEIYLLVNHMKQMYVFTLVSAERLGINSDSFLGYRVCARAVKHARAYAEYAQERKTERDVP